MVLLGSVCHFDDVPGRLVMLNLAVCAFTIVTNFLLCLEAKCSARNHRSSYGCDSDLPGGGIKHWSRVMLIAILSNELWSTCRILGRNAAHS